MNSRADRVSDFAKIFSESRADAGVSQDWLAAELGVSRKTINNWETGVSAPNYFQQLEWFRALKLSQTPYLYKYVNSEIRSDKNLSKEEKLEQSFDKIIGELTIEQKRCITYLLTGTYQGDPYSLIQLFVAHAHLPMLQRFSIANQIYETYKVCEESNQLKDTEYIMPDLETLAKAIEAGREAAIKGERGYIMKN